MPRVKDWKQTRQHVLRSMFVQTPAVSPFPESHESLELDVDNFELTIERSSCRPDDDEPEEFYHQLQRKISNSKRSDDDSVKLDPPIDSYSGISTDATDVNNNEDDVSQLEHESPDKETSDIDEEEMEEEIEDFQQEKDSESSESFCFSVRPVRCQVHQENKSENTDGQNENDLKRALRKPTKAQLKFYEDNRHDDYLNTTSTGSSSGDLDQRGKIQDKTTEGVGDRQKGEPAPMLDQEDTEIHLLVITPPLRSSASRGTASHPASEAPPSKRNVSIQNVRETVDAGVQMEQETRTTETQTYSEERYRFRSWGVYSSASKRTASHFASEASPSKRNVSIQNVRETVDAAVQTEKKTRTTETQTDSEERNLFRSWCINANMYSSFWFN